MRILLANEARAGAGGVETYLSSLVPALLDGGHAVALLHANPAAEHGPTTIEATEAWSVEDLGLETSLARAAVWRPDVAFSHNMRRLDIDESLITRYPVVKMMHGYFGTCVSGQKAFSFPQVDPCARICGPACLAHYLPRRCGVLRPARMLTQYSWTMRQRTLFSRYAAMVVASEHMRREYVANGANAARLTAIPLFAAVPSSEVCRPSFERANAAVPAPALDVLFLGRMTPLKGADVLLDACSHAATRLGRELSVVMAGEGPLRDRITRGAPGVRVECPGWVDERDRQRLLRRAAVVAIPSRWPEPFGLVGLEAAAEGVPAVAFAVGGISSWLTDGGNGRLVDPDGGARAFGESLAGVIGDASLRTRLSAQARKAAVRFSRSAHVQALEGVLRGVAELVRM